MTSSVIVIGNHKGGSGKTTIGLHLLLGLAYEGFKIGSIDLDVHQTSLTRFVEARKDLQQHIPLPQSDHYCLDRSERNAAQSLQALLDRWRIEKDFIIIDTPGSVNDLSHQAHAEADLVITPVNDSFMDLSVLGCIHPDELTMVQPSNYSLMIWEQKKKRALHQKKSIAWLVIRNRLASLSTRNKNDVGEVIASMAKRLGFQFIDGVGERVIYRELFLKGLCILDPLNNILPQSRVAMSHLMARNEIRLLVTTAKKICQKNKDYQIHQLQSREVV